MESLIHYKDLSDREDEILLSKLYTEYAARLSYYACKQVRDKLLAEDIVQECFLSFWKRRAEFAIRNITPAYLYSSVRKKILTHYRDQKGTQTVEPDEQLAAGVSMEYVIEPETYQQLFLSFQQLPPQCQVIFNKLYREGKSFKEIAKELNITESTIRTQKSKGIQLIRLQLRHLLFGDSLLLTIIFLLHEILLFSLQILFWK